MTAISRSPVPSHVVVTRRSPRSEDARGAAGPRRAGIRRGRARDALILAHQPLVRSIARRFARTGLPLEDLEAEGYLGLLEAAQRFDRHRGTTFGTYAAWWVRVFIQRFTTNNRRIVATPQTRAMRRIQQIRKVERDLEQAAGEAATAGAIATVLRLRPEQVREARSLVTSRDLAVRTGQESGVEVRDEGPSPEEEAADHELARQRGDVARRAMAILDARERIIVESRVLREDRETLESLGLRFGITRERVRQIEARALEKMRRVVCPA